MNKHKYLPHIDGLRAISVILVILFHYMIGPFSGGYIEVDVFFTISGFLIIGSIVGQLEAGTFSALDFWQRRIRRLIPAILATLFLCLATGFLIMNSDGFSNLAKQSLFALFSLINFTLLGKVDYFDQSSPDEPLLHFWSLAVEEQFYFVFPIIALLLFLILKKNKNYKAVMIGLLIILSIVSVIAAESLIKNGQNLMAYYMMPTRFSQLAMGGALAISLQYEKFTSFLQKIPQSIHALITISGIAAIGYVATTFTVNTSFPGLNSTLPTYGALAVLMSGGRNYLKPALENSIASYIGKLSYSLYLVHWPVWAFLAYYLNRDPQGAELIGALITSLGLSMFIYHFVEKPFRFGPTFKAKAMYKFLIPGITAMVLCAGTIVKLNGVPIRIPADRRAFVKDAYNYHINNFGGDGYTGNANVLGDPDEKADFLIIGDSKARQFASGIDNYLKENKRKAILISSDACPMIEDVITYKYGKIDQICIDRVNQVIQFIKDTDIPIISLRGWSNVSPMIYKGQKFSMFDKGGYKRLAQFHLDFHKKLLADNPQRKIFLIGSNEGFENAAPITDCLTRPDWLGLYCLNTNNFEAKTFKIPRVESFIKTATESLANLTFIPMVDVYCDEGVCRQFSKDGKILFSDPTHLSKVGSNEITVKLLTATGLVRDGETKPGALQKENLDICDNNTADIERLTLSPPFIQNGTVGWNLFIPELVSQASTDNFPKRSKFTLCENGEELKNKNAAHATVTETGKGNYSHWNEYLYFSTSDNSDPNRNQRHYEMVIPKSDLIELPINLNVCDNNTADIERLTLSPPFIQNGTVGWNSFIPELVSQASNNDFPKRSKFTLCENGEELKNKNAPHATVTEAGKGNYSHWNEYLYFSTSDNSDPNRNQRHYEMVIPKSDLIELPIKLNVCDNNTADIERLTLSPPFIQNGTVGWNSFIPELVSQASNNNFPNRSKFTLCENGEELKNKNAPHATVTETGKGNYSHWNEYLYFSTSDNSDPNRNEKKYELVISQKNP